MYEENSRAPHRITQRKRGKNEDMAIALKSLPQSHFNNKPPVGVLAPTALVLSD